MNSVFLDDLGNDVDELAAQQDNILTRVIDEFRVTLNAPVAADDNFFALGGTSFLAAALATRLTSALSRTVDLAAILRNPSPEALVSFLQGAEPTRTEPGPTGRRLGPDRAGPGKVGPDSAGHAADTCELSLPQRWYAELYTGDLQKFGVIWFTIDLPDGTGLATVRRVLAALTARHDSLRTSIELVEGRLCQRLFTSAGMTALLAADPGLILTEQVVDGGHEEVARAAVLASARQQSHGISYEGIPLFRALLMRGTAPSARPPAKLVVTVHHIIFDGASQAVFRRDFAALLDGREETLAPAISYRGYTESANGGAGGVGAEQAGRWWRRHFGTFGGGCHLPVRHQPDGNPSWLIQRTLPPDLCRSVADLARSRRVPISVLRLTAMFLLAHALYETDDVAVCMPTDGRSTVELQNAIGMFVNFVALRHRISEAESVEDMVTNVAAEIIDVMEHREYPFSRNMREIRGGDVPGRFPVSGLIINGEETTQDLGPSHERAQVQPLQRRNVFDFQVYFLDSPGRVDVEVQHRADLLTQDEGVQLLDLCVGLLAAVGSPEGGTVRSLLAKVAPGVADAP